MQGGGASGGRGTGFDFRWVEGDSVEEGEEEEEEEEEDEEEESAIIFLLFATPTTSSQPPSSYPPPLTTATFFSLGFLFAPLPPPAVKTFALPGLGRSHAPQ